MVIDPSSWPRDFASLQANPPQGIFFGRNVLDPVLVIVREGEHYKARLGATRLRRGVQETLLAPGPDFNWVLGDGVAHPLPLDVADVTRKRLQGLDAEDLSFPQVLALQRDGANTIQVQLDPSVLRPANEQASYEATDAPVEGLNAVPYEYQAKGIAWMHHALRRTGGVILADEMGLGKTLQILGLLLLDRPSDDSPALIICPTSLIANWVRETEKFAPSLTLRVHRGPDRARLHRDLQRSQIVITTYDTIVNDLVLFKAIEWSYVICDEAQAIKNPSSQRRQAVAELPRKKAIPVTGTPVETSLVDLWSLADFAIPGLLGSQVWFEENFPDTEESARLLAQLTDPILLKRQVRDVAQELPERIDVEVPVELDKQLAEGYNEVLRETLERYPTAGALVATGQLQLFCAHPWLRTTDVSTEGWEERIEIGRKSGFPIETPKIQRTIELLNEAFANHRKVLIFASFNQCGPILREAAGGVPEVFWDSINGSTPAADRQAIVDAFSAHHGAAVLVLNPRAAGAGLNITAATVVIHFTQVWNPALEQQASARAHRRGQTQPVSVYHMFYVDTVEEVMIERAQRRRELGSSAVPTTSQERIDLARALSLSPVRQ